MARCDVVIRVLSGPSDDVEVATYDLSINGEQMYASRDGFKVEAGPEEATALTLTLLPTSLRIIGPED